MLDREYPSQLRARAKSWWVFTVLSVIAIACASCNNAAQQTSQPRNRTVQSPHVTVAAGLPLTDSAPPQLDMTPTVPVSPPTPLSAPAIATPTPTPRVLQTTTIDDSIMGTGLNQFNYVGNWRHCTGGCNGCCYNGTWSWDNTADDYVTLSFTGIQIKFYGVIGPYGGFGGISIDGGSETMVNCYSTEAIGNQLMWTSPMLPAGNHTFKLRATGTKGDPSSQDAEAAFDRVDILS